MVIYYGIIKSDLAAQFPYQGGTVTDPPEAVYSTFVYVPSSVPCPFANKYLLKRGRLAGYLVRPTRPPSPIPIDHGLP